MSDGWPYQPYTVKRCHDCDREKMFKWMGTGAYPAKCPRCGKWMDFRDTDDHCPDGSIMVCGEKLECDKSVKIVTQ